MPFALHCACPRCARQVEVTISDSRKAISCDGCGSTLVRRIEGYLYVLSNPEIRGLLKIGQTGRSVDERVAELNDATGVPSPFVVEAYFETVDPQGHELEVHKRLAAQRLPGREFFRVSVTEAVDVTREVTGTTPIGSVKSQAGFVAGWNPSAPKPSIFRRWRCTKCSREFKAVGHAGMCCGQQATNLGAWTY
jgi:ribosomal protein S27E